MSGRERDTGHAVVSELLGAYADGALGEEELRRVEAHLAECERCRREVIVQTAVRAHLMAGAPPPASPALRQRIARITTPVEEVGRPTAAPDPPGSRRRTSGGSRGASWAGWGVAAGFAALLLTHHSFHRPLQFGWVVASALGLLLAAVAAYALRQRARVADLREEMKLLEGEAQQGVAVEHGWGRRPET